MLRPSRINPKLSAYNQVWGNFDYNKTPLAPPRCKVVVHESAEKRDSIGYHGKEGFYCGWSPNHYQNVNCWIKETGGMRDSATVEFFPKYVQMPKTSSKDRLAAVLEDLVEIVKHKKHPARPSLQLGTETNDAIRQLEEIFAPPKQDTDESSRVLDTATDKRMAPHAEPRVDTTIYPTGTIVMKKFGKGIHRGEVKRYDEDRKYYWIDYDNGNSEEMTQK